MHGGRQLAQAALGRATIWPVAPKGWSERSSAALVSCGSMSPEQQQLEAGIQAFEAQRPLLGDAVVDMAVAPIKARLAALSAPPAPPAEPAQALKQVSILFLDVVGSTSLSQQLDPEAISGVFDGAMARCAGVIERHRGKVMQYAGDSVMAVFGALESREDDTERAVQCGLALLALGKALGAEVLGAHGHDGFNVRVGIHTAFLFALGHFRMGRLVRFMPYPVVGGTLAGTGWLMTAGAIGMMTDQPLGLPLL
ncbi:MAG: hypothetical protein H7337_12460, partial [Rhizobacter sp.]|nr:hypothetical protein [Rhizobacter sp.]